MKIRDLVQRTRISRETVHYYIREGILPKPRKRGMTGLGGRRNGPWVTL